MNDTKHARRHQASVASLASQNNSIKYIEQKTAAGPKELGISGVNTNLSHCVEDFSSKSKIVFTIWKKNELHFYSKTPQFLSGKF